MARMLRELFAHLRQAVARHWPQQPGVFGLIALVVLIGSGVGNAVGWWSSMTPVWNAISSQPVLVWLILTAIAVVAFYRSAHEAKVAGERASQSTSERLGQFATDATTAIGSRWDDSFARLMHERAEAAKETQKQIDALQRVSRQQIEALQQSTQQQIEAFQQSTQQQIEALRKLNQEQAHLLRLYDLKERLFSLSDAEEKAWNALQKAQLEIRIPQRADYPDPPHAPIPGAEYDYAMRNHRWAENALDGARGTWLRIVDEFLKAYTTIPGEAKIDVIEVSDLTIDKDNALDNEHNFPPHQKVQLRKAVRIKAWFDGQRTRLLENLARTVQTVSRA